MSTQVVMPQMGESVAEGTIVRWLKKAGDPIERDEPLFEISTDKVDAEIPSPAAGVVGEIKVKEGETVPVNTVVAVINEASSAAHAASASAAGAMADKPAAKAASVAPPAPPAASASAAAAATSDKVAPRAEDNRAPRAVPPAPRVAPAGASGAPLARPWSAS